jgi:aspartate-semialdehyde dehydrogenase
MSPKKFTKRIAFNIIPHIDVFMEDGSTKEEWKMKVETKKIMDDSIDVSVTCVRVPVFVSHGEAVNIEFENPISVDQAREALDESDGILVLDKPEDNVYSTPVEAATQDSVFVSRIRKDDTIKNGLNMWVVADNLRKGAALNAVQIAEILVSDHGL